MAQTIFITGTSTGIGTAAVRLFASRGWQVAATMRNPADARFARPARRARLCPRRDGCGLRVAGRSRAQQDFGQLAVLVNNAGYGLVGPFGLATPAQIQPQFAANVFGVFAVTQAVLPAMRA